MIKRGVVSTYSLHFIIKQHTERVVDDVPCRRCLDTNDMFHYHDTHYIKQYITILDSRLDICCSEGRMKGE